MPLELTAIITFKIALKAFLKVRCSRERLRNPRNPSDVLLRPPANHVSNRAD